MLDIIFSYSWEPVQDIYQFRMNTRSKILTLLELSTLALMLASSPRLYLQPKLKIIQQVRKNINTIENIFKSCLERGDLVNASVITDPIQT